MPNLTNHRRLQIHEHSSGDMLASTSLSKESGERVISNGFVRGHLTIRLDSMFKTVQFPAGIAHLDTGLTDMDRDTFTHFELTGLYEGLSSKYSKISANVQ